MLHSLLIPLTFLLASNVLAETPGKFEPLTSEYKATNPRYVTLETRNDTAESTESPTLARCAFDRKTSLTWEVKSRNEGLQYANLTYSWYEPNKKINGGYAGYRNQGKCGLVFCDTQTYIAKINAIKLCGRSDWRLPTREELRSLVDYNVAYPGPSIDQKAFPNTVNQFYWSATPDANDSDSAWGIGFSFGYDYAYFKSDQGYIRLVSGPN